MGAITITIARVIQVLYLAYSYGSNYDHQDVHYHNGDQFGDCTDEDRRDAQELWEYVWSSSSTQRKMEIGQAIADMSVPFHFIL